MSTIGRRGFLAASITVAGAATGLGAAAPAFAAPASVTGPSAARSSTGLTAPAAPTPPLYREHPWLRTARTGLFLHWGMFTAPAFTDAAAWEAEVTGSGWTAEYWVREALKLKASYLVLVTFHSRLGYARAWPSQIPGSGSTRRDFLGELIAAAKKRGLKVICYVTDDPQWHDATGTECLDSAAYSAYKGKAVDLTTREGFGEYSYDVFVELMRNYPELAGFWIDNDNEYWERNKLYERIRTERPDMTLSNNNEDTPIMDMVSHEQKKGMLPDYDYSAATWTPLPRLAEGCFTVGGNWWYEGKNNTVDYPLTIRRVISNVGASIRSLIAEGAQHSGRFTPNIEAFNNYVADWFDGMWESVDGTEGGGYMYGGLQPGWLNDGAFAAVTVARHDPRLQYLHVTTRPTSDTFVRVRDNGYRITRVEDLRTGRRMPFVQENGTLTIRSVSTWDDYDTVFRIRTTGDRAFVLPGHRVRATATSSKAGFPASNLVDGDFTTYWDAGDTIPVSITLDLGEVRNVACLGVNHHEWSPTQNRETFGRKEDSARIKEYGVQVSRDGRNWSTVIASAELESAKAVRFIDLDTRARYVRIDVASTWALESVPAYYRKLLIDSIEVTTGHPRSRG
ncbi:alpha-L-fucosidase [Streptomyces sp. NBC_01267]|uniref:discoidin domain-containing protein n=1 Tax=unclassified Streptomyces TaxID=2593676 RepID=UPI00224EFFC3|nr:MULTISPECIES: discoidin domain-containing protein [unclassified Streptomyces]MCX4550642.1 alpha-L-fucosidase [Streptomyces sp. NBC_01500]WSC22086.1 alpha-L-fucosidase [Streptomyces sp. NBC_01766]